MANFIKEADGGNKILEWAGDAATTRKQVPVNERKAGMQISYTPDGENWLNEQYVGKEGAYLNDGYFEKDEYWVKITDEKFLRENIEPYILNNSDLQNTFKDSYYITPSGSFSYGSEFKSKVYDVSNVSSNIDLYLYAKSESILYAFYDGDGTSSSNLIGRIEDYPKGPFNGVLRNLQIPDGAKSLIISVNKIYPENRGFCTLSNNSFIKDFSEEDKNKASYIKNIPEQIKSRVAKFLVQSANACNHYIINGIDNSTDFIPVENGDEIYVRSSGSGTQYSLITYNSRKEVITNYPPTGNIVSKYIINNDEIKYIKSLRSKTPSELTTNEYFVFIKRTANEAALEMINIIENALNTKLISPILAVRDAKNWDFTGSGVNTGNGIFGASDNVSYMYLLQQANLATLGNTQKVSIGLIAKVKLINSHNNEAVTLSTYSNQTAIKSLPFNIGDEQYIYLLRQYNSNSADIKADKSCQFQLLEAMPFSAVYGLSLDEIYEWFNLLEKKGKPSPIIPPFSHISSISLGVKAPVDGEYASFGDSYTANVGASAYTGYPARVARYFGLTLNNLGVAGSKPIADSNLSDANLAKINPNTVLVSITGGTNGWTTDDDINSRDRSTSVGSINYAIDYIETNFPRAYIVLMTMPRVLQEGEGGQAVQDMKAIAANRHLPIADIYNTIVPNERTKDTILADDKYHYSAIGYEKIAGVLINVINSVMY